MSTSMYVFGALGNGTGWLSAAGMPPELEARLLALAQGDPCLALYFFGLMTKGGPSPASTTRIAEYDNLKALGREVKSMKQYETQIKEQCEALADDEMRKLDNSTARLLRRLEKAGNAAAAAAAVQQTQDDDPVPMLCAVDGCKFFGTAETGGMCSQCHVLAAAPAPPAPSVSRRSLRSSEEEQSDGLPSWIIPGALVVDTRGGFDGEVEKIDKLHVHVRLYSYEGCTYAYWIRRHRHGMPCREGSQQDISILRQRAAGSTSRM